MKNNKHWNLIFIAAGIICLFILGFVIQLQLTNYLKNEKKQYLETQSKVIQSQIQNSFKQDLIKLTSWTQHPAVLEFVKEKLTKDKTKLDTITSLSEMSFFAVLIENGILSNANYMNTYLISNTGTTIWQAEPTEYNLSIVPPKLNKLLNDLERNIPSYFVPNFAETHKTPVLFLLPIFNNEQHQANIAIEIDMQMFLQNMLELASASTESVVLLYGQKLDRFSIIDQQAHPDLSQIDNLFNQQSRIEPSMVQAWHWDDNANVGVFLSLPNTMINQSLGMIRSSMILFVSITLTVMTILLVVLNKNQGLLKQNQRNIQRQQNRLQHIQELAQVAGLEFHQKKQKVIWYSGFEFLDTTSDGTPNTPDNFISRLAISEQNKYNNSLYLTEQTQQSQALEIFYLDNAQQEHYFLIKMFPQAAQKNLSASTIALISNITEQKLQQKAALQAEVDYRDLILESAHDGIIGVDMSGNTTVINKAALDMLAFSQSQLTQTPFEQLVKITRDKAGLEPLNIFDQVIKEPNSNSYACWFSKLDNTRFPVDCRVSPIIRSGKQIGVVYLFKDITEQRKAEQEKQTLSKQLRHAQKMEAIGQLTGGIAHDFNNILASVLGYTELVQECIENGKSSNVPDYLKQVIQSGERARDLIKQMMVFTRKDSQQLQNISVNALVQDSLNMLKPLVPSSIEVKLQLEAQAVLTVDLVQFQQLLMNLIINAKDAMADQGVLSISTAIVNVENEICASCHQTFSQRSVLLNITDSGEGISESTINKIFDPYFTTKELGEGTGMGLSIVHGIVHQLNGHLTVKSEAGNGASFSVYLPLPLNEENSPNTVDEAQTPPPKKLTNARILVIDDETSIAHLLDEKLSLQGYKVTALTDSVEAVGLIADEKNQFDLIISDQTMPFISGIELATTALEYHPQMPIIICTGYSDKINEKTALKQGVYAYLEKPIDFKKLLTEIESALVSHI